MPSKKSRRAAGPPVAHARLAAFPGTRVLAWIVDECPLCGARHFHSAGGRDADPRDKLGETKAPCEDAVYLLAEPPKPAKKQKSGRRKKRSLDDDWE